MAEKEQTINITVTVPLSIGRWLDEKVAEDESNRSHVARKIFKKAKLEDERTRHGHRNSKS